MLVKWKEENIWFDFLAELYFNEFFQVELLPISFNYNISKQRKSWSVYFSIQIIQTSMQIQSSSSHMTTRIPQIFGAILATRWFLPLSSTSFLAMLIRSPCKAKKKLVSRGGGRILLSKTVTSEIFYFKRILFAMHCLRTTTVRNILINRLFAL